MSVAWEFQEIFSAKAVHKQPLFELDWPYSVVATVIFWLIWAGNAYISGDNTMATMFLQWSLRLVWGK